MATYHVMWEIEIEADSHHEAAREALKIHRDPESTATVFYVHAKGETRRKFIDLTPEQDWR